jgi:hypothetical protein
MAHSTLGADCARNNSNVVRLPTAAHRKVTQSCRAVREYRVAQPKWPGTYELPAVRDAKRIASGKSPETLMLIAVMKVLTKEQRTAAANIVHKLAFLAPDDATYTASIMMAELAQ